MTTHTKVTRLELEIANLKTELAELRTENEKLVSMVDSATSQMESLMGFVEDALLMIDGDGRFIDANPAAVRLFAMPLKDLLAKSCADFFPEHWQKKLKPAVINKGEDTVTTHVIAFEAADQSIHHVECRLRPFLFKEQHLLYLRDFTHQIEVEQFAHTSETSFKTLAENIPDNITQVDTALNYTYVNPVYARRLNLKPEDLIGKPSSDFSLHSDIRDQWITARRKVIATGQPTSIEFSVERGDQGIQTYHALLVPEFDQNGVVESVLSVSREITEYKTIQERLRENMAFANRITEISPYIIFVYDVTEGEMVFANPVAREYLANAGIAADGKERQPVRSAFHPDDLKQLDRATVEDLYTNKKQVLSLRCRIRHHSDDWRQLMMYLTLFHHVPEQATVQILGVAQDITEQEQAEKQAFQLALEQERIHILTDFIHSISHEFRTPLASISMTTFLLERVLNQEHLQYIERIQNASDQISNLIEGMLQLTELDALRELYIEPYDISEIVLMVIDAHSERASQRQITVEPQIEDQLPRLQINRTYLFNAMSHLLENAIRYGKEQGYVRIRVHQQDGNLCVMIQDDGIGIPKEQHGRIFERFYRLDDARSTRGLGLGLPIAQRIIELHGGVIELNSTPGEGTTFTVKLPLLPLVNQTGLTSAAINGSE